MNIDNNKFLTFKKEFFFKNNIKRFNSNGFTSILNKTKFESNDMNKKNDMINNDSRKSSFYSNKVYFYFKYIEIISFK